MENKIKGVNLGGWLVLEKWMSPQLFEGTKSDDEYYLAHDLPEDIYKNRIEMHRANFITEGDIIRISTSGYNLIRLPVPYFVFGDREPFIGAIEYVDKVFKWANEYNLNILLDLHTAPKSQNGFDNGGISGVCKWAQDENEVKYVLTVLTRLAERYKEDPKFWGIEILNEPVTKNIWEKMNIQKRFPPRDKEMAKNSQPIDLDFLYAFYLEAYTRLREILTKDTVIVFHDAFELEAWENFFKTNNLENVMLDTHQYIMSGESEGVSLDLQSYIEYLESLGEKISKVNNYVPVFVGEWSLFNSYTVGIDTKGGINPTQNKFGSLSRQEFTDNELKDFYRKIYKASVTSWDKGAGHVYWNYKVNIDTVNEPEWYGWDSWDASRGLSFSWINLE